VERYYQIVDRNEKKSIRLNIDIEEWDRVLKYLKSDPQINKEYIEISQILLRNLVNADKYKSIQTPGKHKDYYEMIFTGSGRNDSILCKEYSNKEHRDIIMIEVFKLRKGESNISRMVNRILETGGFDYDIE
jgi:hypothetical protein